MKRLLTIIAALLLSISMIFANGSQEAKSAESDDGLSGTITMIAMANQAKVSTTVPQSQCTNSC